MLKILFIFITLTLTGFITIWFKKDPGTISIIWHGWLIESSIPIISTLILLLFSIILLLFYVSKRIIFFPKSLHKSLNNRRKIKADTAIIKGFAAKNMGEIRLA
ncbi:MAG: heme biosynthesis HemY N-terminal domain-containing protein, partial [Alphaproteobacteria bacterium]